MRTVCIYHSVDLDGWMSAAVVSLHAVSSGGDIVIRDVISDTYLVRSEGEVDRYLDLIGWDYGHEVPDLSMYDEVIMVDISFPRVVMEEIAPKLIWIDHHLSAMREMDMSKDFNYNVKRRITSTDYAACELAWFHFFSYDNLPEVVRLLGRYDCFGHRGTEEEREVVEFQYGARQLIGSIQECFKAIKHSLSDYSETQSVLIDEIRGVGKVIYRYLYKEAQFIYHRAFPAVFMEGDHLRKFLVVNHERFNPINFGIDYHEDGYDGFASFWMGGSGRWHFALYNDNGKVDCSVICKRYGGGGHAGAAGFIVDDLEEVLI